VVDQRLPDPNQLDQVLIVLRRHAVAKATIGELTVEFAPAVNVEITEASEEGEDELAPPGDVLAAYDRATRGS
jgi:hypothetical protein